jgi:hypothetical protein
MAQPPVHTTEGAYEMKQFPLSRPARSLSLGAMLATALTCVAAGPASAATTSVDTSMCANPLLSEPFVSAGDQNEYALVPGQTPDNVNGSGWTLSGGAALVTTTVADGATGSVLDLPSGSKAVSPAICVMSDYPTARMDVRDIVGSQGVSFYVSYEGTSGWTTPRNTGQVHGTGAAWTLSAPVNLQPASTSGWQIVRFTLVPGGTTSNFEIYDLYADPRMMR